jgi:hypothetical protein
MFMNDYEAELIYKMKHQPKGTRHKQRYTFHINWLLTYVVRGF